MTLRLAFLGQRRLLQKQATLAGVARRRNRMHTTFTSTSSSTSRTVRSSVSSQPRCTQQQRWLHSTLPLQEAAKGNSAAAETAPPSDNDNEDASSSPSENTDSSLDESSTSSSLKEQPDDKDDPVPEWQNPRHHNDPELEKVFSEDFSEGETMPIVPLPPLNDEPLPHLEALADEILQLNMLEMNELVNRIADHFGFVDDAVSSTSSTESSASEEEAAEEVEAKTTFELKLMGFDSKSKIKVIKEVRAIAGLGLKEAKELVEGAPKVVQKDLKQEEAEELKKKLEAVGATVEVV